MITFEMFAELYKHIAEAETGEELTPHSAESMQPCVDRGKLPSVTIPNWKKYSNGTIPR